MAWLGPMFFDLQAPNLMTGSPAACHDDGSTRSSAPTSPPGKPALKAFTMPRSLLHDVHWSTLRNLVYGPAAAKTSSSRIMLVQGERYSKVAWELAVRTLNIPVMTSPDPVRDFLSGSPAFFQTARGFTRCPDLAASQLNVIPRGTFDRGVLYLCGRTFLGRQELQASEEEDDFASLLDQD